MIKTIEAKFNYIAVILLTAISVYAFVYYLDNGLGLAYNDARSHLNIARRVVEGLKPGIAQLGSVWLPLPHILTAMTVWNDFMWHSGLAGALISMISFIATGILILKILDELKVNFIGKVIGLLIFATNINVLYLQSTAMTELLLLFTMTCGAYNMILWYRDENLLHLITAAFWIMLSSLVRYDGWFLLFWAAVLVFLKVFLQPGNFVAQLKARIAETEGKTLLFLTLAAFGIALWLMWNLLIFKDPFFFAFGPYSAKAQQDQLELSGVLLTKNDWWLSAKYYLYALAYNSNTYLVILGFIATVVFFLDKKESKEAKLASTTLLAPFFFNVLALYLGHSVIFVQGLSGDTWFNVRYGIMLMPSIAIFVGYLVSKVKFITWELVFSILLITFFAFTSYDAVTIDDARVGSSQKNVSEVSGWLHDHAANEKGFVLISAASHDAIIFTSGMPMKRFIHEGTGLYWESATAIPDNWARWIIMRTHDDNDSTWKLVKDTPGFQNYNLVGHFPFADIYEIKPEYLNQLHYEAINVKQR
jgi:hypothetical protein